MRGVTLMVVTKLRCVAHSRFYFFFYPRAHSFNNFCYVFFPFFSPSLQRFQLRWFTPTTEVALCGHATLASAHALFAHAGNVHESLTFDTLSGPLIVSKDSSKGGVGVVVGGGEERSGVASSSSLLRMKFPYNPPTVRPWAPNEDSVVFDIITKVSGNGVCV
jgi:hypothetical protein